MRDFAEVVREARRWAKSNTGLSDFKQLHERVVAFIEKLDSLSDRLPHRELLMRDLALYFTAHNQFDLAYVWAKRVPEPKVMEFSSLESILKKASAGEAIPEKELDYCWTELYTGIELKMMYKELVEAYEALLDYLEQKHGVRYEHRRELLEIDKRLLLSIPHPEYWGCAATPEMEKNPEEFREILENDRVFEARYHR